MKRDSVLGRSGGKRQSERSDSGERLAKRARMEDEHMYSGDDYGYQETGDAQRGHVEHGYDDGNAFTSDDDDEDAGVSAPVPQSDDVETPGAGSDGGQDEAMADGPIGGDDDEDDEDAAASRAARGRKPARVLDDEDEDE